jgi:hypothetical protein
MHNLTVLNCLMQATNYNLGMHTLIDDFAGKYRRINELMGIVRGRRGIELISRLIEKFSPPVVPYPGGPIYAELWSYANLNWYNNQVTDWLVAIDIDRGVTSGDVIKLILDDTLLSLKEIMGESGDTTTDQDYRLIANILAALGFSTVRVPEVRLSSNPAMWEHLQFDELFGFMDNKGAGADTWHYKPVAGSVDAQIHRFHPKGYTTDYLDFIGYLPNAAYATEVTDNDLVYGCLPLGLNGPGNIQAHRIYTIEDGWFSTWGAMDLTAADTLQDFIWSAPWITKHRYSSML